ncbi:MAG TPA: SRPBCC family protein [Allosphingosinicella sp.]|nr:SRPBCC family protein [Allosphingosinicella sp.]
MTDQADPARVQCRDSVRIAAPAEAVWAVVGDLASLVPGGGMVERIELDGEGAGAIRTFHLSGGARVVERIESHEPALRCYSYRILDFGPLPFADYVGAAEVIADGRDGCLLSWSADATPAGVDAATLRTIVAANLDGALQAVAAHFRPAA